MKTQVGDDSCSLYIIIVWYFDDVLNLINSSDIPH